MVFMVSVVSMALLDPWYPYCLWYPWHLVSACHLLLHENWCLLNVGT